MSVLTSRATATTTTTGFFLRKRLLTYRTIRLRRALGEMLPTPATPFYLQYCADVEPGKSTQGGVYAPYETPTPGNKGVPCMAVVLCLLVLAPLQCRDGARRVSPTRQTSLESSAKRREVFGKSHEG